MLPVAERQDAAADEDEEDKDNGEGAEDFVLPEVEPPGAAWAVHRGGARP